MGLGVAGWGAGWQFSEKRVDVIRADVAKGEPGFLVL